MNGRVGTRAGRRDLARNRTRADKREGTLTAPHANPHSRSRPRRFAAIDIGTNTLRSMVVEASAGEGFRVLDTEKIPNRLGEGLGEGGRLGENAIRGTLDGLRRLRDICVGHGCSRIEVVATSALREATNGREVIREIHRSLGMRARIIDGDEEAHLAYRSAGYAFPLGAGRVALVDVGGGSAEILLAAGGVVEEVVSLPLGAVRLAQDFLKTDPPARAELRRMRKRIRETLRHSLREALPGVRLIASGGSANALVRIVLGLQGVRAPQAHGAEVSRSSVEHAWELMRGMDGSRRRRLRGLSPDRVDIIVPGVLVLREVMRALDANSLLVNEGGIREGLILEMIDQAFPSTRTGAEPRAQDAMESALRFARACRYEPNHAESVRGFARRIFDALRPLHHLGPSEREVLELAAVLHDVGYFIAYPRHHRHSYHLISHADLRGLDQRRQAWTALVARYHRRSLPKESHPEFARLAPEERYIVCWLAGILRFADGLDRGHAQRIERLRITLPENEICVFISASESVELEVWGAGTKRDLLQRVSGRKLVIQQSVRGSQARSGAIRGHKPS